MAAAAGSLAVVAFYLIAQMVGAGNLIRLLFGLDYEIAVAIVGVVMLAYVLFGGMIATTWVQIVKAVLLLSGAFMLAFMVLLQFSFNPLALFNEASNQYIGGIVVRVAPGELGPPPTAEEIATLNREAREWRERNIGSVDALPPRERAGLYRVMARLHRSARFRRLGAAPLAQAVARPGPDRRCRARERSSRRSRSPGRQADDLPPLLDSSSSREAAA